jgi:hypothetical protein
LNTNVDGMTIGDAKLCPQEPDTGVGFGINKETCCWSI